MQNKSIGQTKEDVCIDLLTTEIMVLKERVEELEEVLKKVVYDIDNTNNPYLDITSETLLEIESLINKGNDNE